MVVVVVEDGGGGSGEFRQQTPTTTDGWQAVSTTVIARYYTVAIGISNIHHLHQSSVFMYSIMHVLVKGGLQL